MVRAWGDFCLLSEWYIWCWLLIDFIQWEDALKHAVRLRQGCVAIPSSPSAASATLYMPINLDPHVPRVPPAGTILRVRSTRSGRHPMGLSLHRTST